MASGPSALCSKARLLESRLRIAISSLRKGHAADGTVQRRLLDGVVAKATQRPRYAGPSAVTRRRAPGAANDIGDARPGLCGDSILMPPLPPTTAPDSTSSPPTRARPASAAHRRGGAGSRLARCIAQTRRLAGRLLRPRQRRVILPELLGPQTGHPRLQHGNSRPPPGSDGRRARRLQQLTGIGTQGAGWPAAASPPRHDSRSTRPAWRRGATKAPSPAAVFPGGASADPRLARLLATHAGRCAGLVIAARPRPRP